MPPKMKQMILFLLKADEDIPSFLHSGTDHIHVKLSHFSGSKNGSNFISVQSCIKAQNYCERPA